MSTLAKNIATVAIPNQKVNPLQIDDTLQLLYNLHSTLDVKMVIQQFASGARKFVPCDSIHYTDTANDIELHMGDIAAHHLSYKLNADQVELGHINFSRKHSFTAEEVHELEELLCLLLVPLRNALSHHRLQRSAMHDPLTGVSNRAALNDNLTRELNLSRRLNSQLSLLALDIDLFKSINDQYGHPIGDRMLIHFTNILRTIIRESDMIFRTGGEEFIILLAGTDTSGGIVLADRLRQRVENTPLSIDGENISITTSIGVASLSPGEDAQQLLEKVDKALYRAKEQGRNQVSI